MSIWRNVPASGDLPPYRLFTGDLEKPQLDVRQYRVLELQNGLRAVLVHDPEAEKAAACVALTLGSMHDPIDAPGMAHFCEHMISKGSQQYPEENDYMSFITANGGSHNASTGPMSTDYWFSVNPTKIGEGLSRLAAFFCSPLFTESLTAREINAVDSEFKRNLQNDVRRVYQITKHLSVPGHPWRKFGTGNYASLSEVGRQGKEDADEESVMKETRRRLVEWWQEHYCASRMALAVVGKDSLDKLTSMVVPSFSKVLNRGYDPKPAIKEPVWGPEQMGTVIFIQTVKDYHAFSLQFELPDLREHYQSKPTSFLAHFLGHEGPGSICTYLKKQGWLLDLSSGRSGDSRSVEVFKVEGKLTLEGYLHYEAVLEAIFDYISLMRRSFPLQPYYYAELASMADTTFRLLQKTQPHTYAAALAEEFAEPYPPEWLLSGSYLYRERDDAMVQQLLDGLLPERARVLLLAKEHRPEVIGPDLVWETEKWYGTQYARRRFQEPLLRQLREPRKNDEFFLPLPNPFIPTDLSVHKTDIPEPAKYPTLICRTQTAQLWHKQDDQFWVPKAHVRIVLKSPLAYATARHTLMTRLFVDLVEDALAEVTYDADLAGLAYSVSNHDEGVTVSVGGYNDKLDVLLRIVLEKIRNLTVHAARLRVMKEKVKRDYEHFYLGQPSQLSETFAKWLFTPTVWSPAEKLKELDLISDGDVERQRDDLLSKVVIEVLVNGNITRQRSLKILSLIEQSLPSQPLLPSEVPAPHSLVISAGSNVILRKRHANPDELNNSLSYYCQFGESSDIKLRSIAALIHHIIREPCFSTLRTQEQLGYIVATPFWSVNNSTFGLGIKLQSTRAPWFLETRVEAFLEAFRARLAGLTEAAFATHKQGLVAKKLERVKNLSEETTRFWNRIRAGHYDFLRHETDAATISALTLPEVVAVYDRLLCPSSGAPTRKKLSVQLISQQLHEEAPSPPSGSADISGASPPTAGQKAPEAVQFVARTPWLIASDSEGGGLQGERAFKAALGCAAAATPVMSKAFGQYDRFFHRAGPEGGSGADERDDRDCAPVVPHL